MKRFSLISSVLALLIAVVAAAAGSVSFFADTETSTNNVFTAGAIDLTIDHAMASYNGEPCDAGCNTIIVSDAETQVDSADAVPVLSSATTTQHWTADLDGGHESGRIVGSDGSTWIWSSDPGNPQVDTYKTFTRTFTWSGSATGATLYVATDNSYEVSFNSAPLGADTNDDNFKLATEDTYSISGGDINVGTNTIEVTVKNKGVSGSTVANNPAGLLFKLVIDGTCDQGAYSTGDQCQLWDEKNLETESFFSFGDVKPGDSGVSVISLHIENNDALSCMFVADKADDDNGLTEPESEVDTTDGAGNGELGGELEVFVWDDLNQNGEFNTGEATLYQGDLAGATSLTASSGWQIPASSTGYAGVSWCAGELTALADQPFACDGSNMGNETQTDSFSAALQFYAVQARNNDQFSCEAAYDELNPVI